MSGASLSAEEGSHPQSPRNIEQGLNENERQEGGNI